MKKVLAIFLGLLGAILTMLVYSLFILLTGWYIDSFMISFIFPVGGFILGMGSNICFYLIAKKFDWKSNRLQVGISIAFSLLCFIGIYFTIYSLTFISSDMKLNHIFNGQHISNFYFIGSTEKINFLSYLVHEIGSRQSSIFFSFGQMGNAMPITSYSISGLNGIKFLIEGVGFILGGVIQIQRLRGNYYCDECKRYQKRRKAISLKVDDYYKFSEEEDSVVIDKFGELRKSNYLLPFLYRKAHIRVFVRYCDKCHKGIVIKKHMSPTLLKFEENISGRRIMEAQENQIRQLVN